MRELGTAAAKRLALETLGWTLVVLGIAAIPALDLRLGLPDGGSEPHDSTAYQAYERIEQDFGPGSAGPFVAVVDVAQPVPAEECHPDRQVVPADRMRTCLRQLSAAGQ